MLRCQGTSIYSKSDGLYHFIEVIYKTVFRIVVRRIVYGTDSGF
jgi:hypothetical protein